MSKQLEESKRGKVVHLAAVYAVVAWLLIQVADVVLPTFGAPERAGSAVTFLLVLGFIPVLIGRCVSVRLHASLNQAEAV